MKKQKKNKKNNHYKERGRDAEGVVIGLVIWFNSISTLVVYLKPNPVIYDW